jgi:hypothetical protein
LNNGNKFISVMVKCGVVFEVWTEFLSTTKISFSFKGTTTTTTTNTTTTTTTANTTTTITTNTTTTATIPPPPQLEVKHSIRGFSAQLPLNKTA